MRSTCTALETVTRRPRSSRCSAWWFALLGLMACDDGVQGLSEDLTPLQVLQVRVQGDPAELLPEDRGIDDAQLRVGLLWAGVPTPSNWCLDKAGPGALGALLGMDVPEDILVGELAEGLDEDSARVAEAGCRDPFGFAPGLPGPSVPLPPDGDGLIEIPVLNLPSADILVGSPDARIAYGALVVFDDLDCDGALNIGEPERIGEKFQRRSRGRDGAEEDGDVEETEDEEQDDFDRWFGIEEPDRVLGSSFVSMLDGHTRLVFREGSFQEGSFFYPLMGCEPPPPGFSHLDVSGTPWAADCVSSDIDTPVTVELREPGRRLQELVCRSGATDFFGGPPGSEDRPYEFPPLALKGEVAFACEGPLAVHAARLDAECPGVDRIVLRQCPGTDEAGCEDPDWDISERAPSWWPCTDEPTP